MKKFKFLISAFLALFFVFAATSLASSAATISDQNGVTITTTGTSDCIIQTANMEGLMMPEETVSFSNDVLFAGESSFTSKADPVTSQVDPTNDTGQKLVVNFGNVSKTIKGEKVAMMIMPATDTGQIEGNVNVNVTEKMDMMVQNTSPGDSQLGEVFLCYTGSVNNNISSCTMVESANYSTSQTIKNIKFV